MAQRVRYSLLLREVWGLNSESLKSPTRCHRHRCNLEALAQAAVMGIEQDAHSWHPKGY